MQLKRIGIMVVAAAVLAVMTGGMASALTPWASMNSVSSSGATWVYNSPINHFSAARGGTFTETCYWEQEIPSMYTLDGIYSYNSIYTNPQRNQVVYADLTNSQGAIVSQTTTITASSYYYGTDKDYTVALGFNVNTQPLISSFTSSITEMLTVTP